MPQTDVVSNAVKTRETKEWTLMFYFASDNPLAPSIISQLKSIKDAGFHPDANVIARFDPHGSVMPTHVFEVNLIRKLRAEGLSQVGSPLGDSYVRNLVADKLWGEETAPFPMDDVGEIKDVPIKQLIAEKLRQPPKRSDRNGDGGNARAAYGFNGRGRAGDDFDTDIDDGPDMQQDAAPDVVVEYTPPPLPNELAEDEDPAKSLRSFLSFCGNAYPARHYLLFVVGHGLIVGNDLFLYDENISGAAQAPQQPKKPEGQGGANSDDDAPTSQALLLKQLSTILGGFSDDVKSKGGVLEMVSFHSCSMSSLEVAYEIRNSARYMLASQGPAFVGSWPYRQIVMRVFNDLNCELRVKDLADPTGLVDGLKARTSPVYELLKGRMDEGGEEFSEVWAGLGLHTPGEPPDKKLLEGLVSVLNSVLCDPQMCKRAAFQDEGLAAARRLLEKKRPKYAALSDGDVRRLNRRLFREAFSKVIKERPEVKVEKLLKSIFYYCLYNSLDYQLAGYSFDIALIDLSKVEQLVTPLRGLTEALIAGLGGDDGTTRGLILLAHWDAQSFWEENYTDLYDFCLRLYMRCREISPASNEMKGAVKNIKLACYAMMKALSRDVVPGEPKTEERDPDLDGVKPEFDGGRAVIYSDFAGPAYQYSHGLSIYFPWAEPIASPLWSRQYHAYQLNEDMREDGSSWRCFLKKYFDATMRRPRVEEDSVTYRVPSLNFDRNLIEAIATQIFNESGQLSKAGGNDPMGSGSKAGGNDPMGDGYVTFKNYPTISRRPRKAAAAVRSAEDCEEPRRNGDAEESRPVKTPIGKRIKGLAL